MDLHVNHHTLLQDDNKITVISNTIDYHCLAAAGTANFNSNVAN